MKRPKKESKGKPGKSNKSNKVAKRHKLHKDSSFDSKGFRRKCMSTELLQHLGLRSSSSNFAKDSPSKSRRIPPSNSRPLVKISTWSLSFKESSNCLKEDKLKEQKENALLADFIRLCEKIRELHSRDDGVEPGHKPCMSVSLPSLEELPSSTNLITKFINYCKNGDLEKKDTSGCTTGVRPFYQNKPINCKYSPIVPNIPGARDPTRKSSLNDFLSRISRDKNNSGTGHHFNERKDFASCLSSKENAEKRGIEFETKKSKQSNSIVKNGKTRCPQKDKKDRPVKQRAASKQSSIKNPTSTSPEEHKIDETLLKTTAEKGLSQRNILETFDVLFKKFKSMERLNARYRDKGKTKNSKKEKSKRDGCERIENKKKNLTKEAPQLSSKNKKDVEQPANDASHPNRIPTKFCYHQHFGDSTTKCDESHDRHQESFGSEPIAMVQEEVVEETKLARHEETDEVERLLRDFSSTPMFLPGEGMDKPFKHRNHSNSVTVSDSFVSMASKFGEGRHDIKGDLFSSSIRLEDGFYSVGRHRFLEGLLCKPSVKDSGREKTNSDDLGCAVQKPETLPKEMDNCKSNLSPVLFSESLKDLLKEKLPDVKLDGSLCLCTLPFACSCNFSSMTTGREKSRDDDLGHSAQKSEALAKETENCKSNLSPVLFNGSLTDLLKEKLPDVKLDEALCVGPSLFAGSCNFSSMATGREKSRADDLGFAVQKPETLQKELGNSKSKLGPVPFSGSLTELLKEKLPDVKLDRGLCVYPSSSCKFSSLANPLSLDDVLGSTKDSMSYQMSFDSSFYHLNSPGRRDSVMDEHSFSSLLLLREELTAPAIPSHDPVTPAVHLEAFVDACKPAERVLETCNPTERVLETCKPAEWVIDACKSAERDLETCNPAECVSDTCNPAERVVETCESEIFGSVEPTMSLSRFEVRTCQMSDSCHQIPEIRNDCSNRRDDAGTQAIDSSVVKPVTTSACTQTVQMEDRCLSSTSIRNSAFDLCSIESSLSTMNKFTKLHKLVSVPLNKAPLVVQTSRSPATKCRSGSGVVPLKIVSTKRCQQISDRSPRIESLRPENPLPLSVKDDVRLPKLLLVSDKRDSSQKRKTQNKDGQTRLKYFEKRNRNISFRCGRNVNQNSRLRTYSGDVNNNNGTSKGSHEDEETNREPLFRVLKPPEPAVIGANDRFSRFMNEGKFDEALRTTFEKEFSVDWEDPWSGERALACAVVKSRYEIISRLLDLGSILDAPDFNGRTAFLASSLRVDRRAAWLLLSHGLEIACDTPLKVASGRSKSVSQFAKFLELALSSGFRPRKDRKWYETVVRGATTNQNAEVEHPVRATLELLSSCSHPPSLSMLCFVSIRRHLAKLNKGRSITCSVKGLPLPGLLKGFLCMDGHM